MSGLGDFHFGDRRSNACCGKPVGCKMMDPDDPTKMLRGCVNKPDRARWLARVEAESERLRPLWWHLTEVHGLAAHQTHGDPELMHAAIVAHGMCSDPEFGGTP